ncbi:Nudix hydrolase 2 [Ananas comosus]|uniref:Nudix hydrolase 2 n=2 Tax=Ananas comosus TaxID=4615 RepID=A0A199VNB7_ANACO|nr:Nudix hydrolase 2 [Ananas comosus]
MALTVVAENDNRTAAVGFSDIGFTLSFYWIDIKLLRAAPFAVPHNGSGRGRGSGDVLCKVFRAQKLSLTLRISSPFRESSRRFMSNSTNSSSVEPALLSENVQMLAAVDDDHGGVIVEMSKPMDAETFASSLRASLSDWKNKGIKGVWIKLPRELVNLIQPALEEGFWFHHAEPSYLMLVYWIPNTEHNTIPANASHKVRIGAFVMDDRRQVLVVQEKMGEDLHVGALREVKEETGIDTEFVEVLAFRQSHKSLFEKSELFFLCLLRPLSFEIQRQESEIDAAAWMPIDDFKAQPFVQNNDIWKHMVEICSARVDGSYTGFSSTYLRSTFTDSWNYLYWNQGNRDPHSRASNMNNNS